MTKYGAKAQRIIEKTVHEYEDDKLHIGQSDKKVTDYKQAVAIGISKARAKGYKVPKEGK